MVFTYCKDISWGSLPQKTQKVSSWIDASPAKSGTLISKNQHKPVTNVSLSSQLITISIAQLTKSTMVERQSNDRDLFKLC